MLKLPTVKLPPLGPCIACLAIGYLIGVWTAPMPAKPQAPAPAAVSSTEAAAVNAALERKLSDISDAMEEFLADENNLLPKLGNRAFVRAAYQIMLGRNADPGDLQNWTKKLDDGQTRAWVLYKQMQSTEFLEAYAKKHKVQNAN